MTEQNLWSRTLPWLLPSCPDLIFSLFWWMNAMRCEKEFWCWSNWMLHVLPEVKLYFSYFCFVQKFQVYYNVQISNWNFIGDGLCHCKENCGFAQPEWGICWPSLLCRRCHQIPDVCKAVQTKGTDELPNGKCQWLVLPCHFLGYKLFYVLLVD